MSFELKSKLQNLVDAANTKTGESDTTLTDAMQTLVDGYGQGGGEITDGIVVKARDDSGHILDIDVYGDVGIYQFGNNRAGTYAWNYLRDVTIKDAKKIDQYAFYYCQPTNGYYIINANDVTSLGTRSLMYSNLINANFPNLTSLAESAIRAMPKLRTVYLPKITYLGKYAVAESCPLLETVQIGSIGYGISFITPLAFTSLTVSGVVITLYTNGSYADTLLSGARSGATKATIVIKASENTTYNGVSYAAGDTMITSEVA